MNPLAKIVKIRIFPPKKPKCKDERLFTIFVQNRMKNMAKTICAKQIL